MPDLDVNKIIAKLNDLKIEEKEKKLFLDLFQNIQSPIKFKYDTLDEKLKPFFHRDKEYYLALENYFKNSNSILEMIKKFLGNLEVRKLFQQEIFLKIDVSIEECNSLHTDFNLEKNNCYALFANYYLFFKFNYEYLVRYRVFFQILPFKFEYILNNGFFLNQVFTIDYGHFVNSYLYEEEKILINIEKKLKEYNLLSFKDLLKADPNDKELKHINYFLESKEKFLVKIGFFKKLMTIQASKDIFKEITNMQNIFIKLKKCVVKDLKQTIKNLNSNSIDINKNIKNKFIKYISDTNTYYQIISFFNSPYNSNSKKFYFELDFSLPEDLVIEQIKSLYKEYKRGNIKTFEEFALNKQVKKYSSLEELQNNYIFKIKDEKKVPLYVKLVDLIYILDMWVINMKKAFVIRQIENNRSRYDNSYKRFESTYKQYEKFIIDFYKNDKYRNYL